MYIFLLVFTRFQIKKGNIAAGGPIKEASFFTALLKVLLQLGAVCSD